MELTQSVRTHYRPRANEMAKGYFPTFQKDINIIAKVLQPQISYFRRNNPKQIISILDPCAGEGEFLSSIVRKIKRDYREESSRRSSDITPCDIEGYAVELDRDRFEKIKGTAQKINSSFFDVSITGLFSIILLNPPYNKSADELVQWVKHCASLLTYSGVMVLIIPEYELVREGMQKMLNGSFRFSYAYLSEEHDRFKQVVVYLSNNMDNQKEGPFYSPFPKSNIGPDDARQKYSVMAHTDGAKYVKKLDVCTLDCENKPFIVSKDMEPVYNECAAMLNRNVAFNLDRLYPSNYDTTLQPMSTLRTAQAIQLAAMNSQIESVTINGEHYLAKYMVIQSVDQFDDPEAGTKTTVYKPTVEAFLMDKRGNVGKAKELGFDYFELNEVLSGAILKKLTKTYAPVHEIGQDEEYLADELKQIGLMVPQREAIKAVMKLFRSGRKGAGIRANTGTGKTWLAKSVKYLTEAKRTIMVTEPQLVPQMVQEYANEGFDVHVIDSWEKMKQLYRDRPKGLYLISYTRLRMHPKYELCIDERKTLVKDKNGKMSKQFVATCPSCRMEVFEKVRKGDKPKCAFCREPLYTYVPENDRPLLNYRKWIKQIEAAGTATEVKSHNKQLPYVKFLKKMRFNLAIFDEAHNAANLMSNQGTSFIRLAAASKKVLVMTATVSNGMAKSLYNLLWGINPEQMQQSGWDMKSTTGFQAKYGAYKEVRKTDEKNRHRESERVATYDTAGISPATLLYTLPNFVNVDSDDFDDLPPVEREVIKCQIHPKAEEAMQKIDKIIQNADLDQQDRLAVASTRNAAYLRISDTFRHANDELYLRDLHLGTVYRESVSELLEKEQKLVDIAQGVVDRGERLLVYTGNTQKVDMRGPLKGILERELSGANGVDVLPDSIAPDKLVAWFQKTTAQIVIASFNRVATGLNLSEFNNLCWYDYTSNTRLAEQGEGRIRRVNTASIHRKIFGHVRPVRYWYMTSSTVQELQLSYTLEKRMVAKLAEGEVPDIDPNECSSGCQSFSALMTKALNEGSFSYQDPSVLLKKMTKNENAKVAAENVPTEETTQGTTEVAPQPEPEAPKGKVYQVIFIVEGRERPKDLDKESYAALLDTGQIEHTLFGDYCRPKQPVKRAA